MLMKYENRDIYLASKPIDFRMSIDGLSQFILKEKNNYLHDGSIYVFYNNNQDKIKCLFWDRNGFVLYYKRLDKCKFKFKKMLENVTQISPSEFETLLAGLEPVEDARKPVTIEAETKPSFKRFLQYDVKKNNTLTPVTKNRYVKKGKII